jgi:hypothetical protein
LRSGDNALVAQVRNPEGARADSPTVTIPGTLRSRRPRIYGLFVGVQDYSGAVVGRKRDHAVANLYFPVADAKAIHQAWMRQGKTKLYDGISAKVLLEKDVRHETLVEAILKASAGAGPDDLFVLFLAGHGYAKEIGRQVFEPATFTFVCPNFDSNRPYETGLHCAELSNLIARIPCRKLVLLDCCHSGSTSVIREMTPEAMGPVIIAACAANESAHDIPYLGHGAFSNALVEALGERFAVADEDKDRVLSVQELFSYVSKRVQRTVMLSRSLLGDDAIQTPQALIPPAAARMSIVCQP